MAHSGFTIAIPLTLSLASPLAVPFVLPALAADVTFGSGWSILSRLAAGSSQDASCLASPFCSSFSAFVTAESSGNTTCGKARVSSFVSRGLLRDSSASGTAPAAMVLFERAMKRCHSIESGARDASKGWWEMERIVGESRTSTYSTVKHLSPSFFHSSVDAKIKKKFTIRSAPATSH